MRPVPTNPMTSVIVQVAEQNAAAAASELPEIEEGGKYPCTPIVKYLYNDPDYSVGFTFIFS